MKLGLSLMMTTAFASMAMAAETTTTTLPAAPEATSTIDAGAAQSGTGFNKKFEDDKNITDTRLRADSGSLSRYSMKVSFGYYGPTLAHLDAKDQPNPDGSVGSYETAVRGSFSARYRIDSTRTISLGTGVTGIHPLHGWDRTDINNPYVSYDWTQKAGGFQMRHSPGLSLITVPNYTKIGEYASPNYYFNTVYNLGESRWALGLDTSIAYFMYNREYDKKDGKAARYNVSLSPNVKYNVNDKLNVNLSGNLSYWNARSIDDQYSLWPRSPTMSTGLGYAVRRDIYLSPYLGFYPDKFSADRITVNMSATVSVL